MPAHPATAVIDILYYYGASSGRGPLLRNCGDALRPAEKILTPSATAVALTTADRHTSSRSRRTRVVMKWRCRFPEPIRVSIYHHTFDSFLMRFRCQMICRVHFAFFTTTEATKPDAMLAQPHVSFVWAIRMPPGVVTHPARRTRPAAGFAASRNRRLGPPTPRRLRRRIRLARRQVLRVGKLVESPVRCLTDLLVRL